MKWNSIIQNSVLLRLLDVAGEIYNREKVQS